MADTTKWTPNDVNKSVKSELPRTRLNATRSMTSEVTTAVPMMAGVTRYHDHPSLMVQNAT